MPEFSDGEQTLPEIALASVNTPPRHLRLTILYHPVCERIGQYAELRGLLAGESVCLSRSRLEFCSPRGDACAAPLADDYISRQPLQLQRIARSEEVLLQPGGSSVSCNGQLVAGSVRLDAATLDRGVVLQLARRVVLYLHKVDSQLQAEDSNGLVGESDHLQRLRRQLPSLAASEGAVLLLGASGTGKELLARALHRCSGRSQGPFVAVNMAAIPMELAASELFGARRGAYTGAAADRPGYFQQAEGGSLFLDEIGACPGAVQPLLLRALQEGEIQSPGAGVSKVNVRVIAATDASLDNSEDQFSAALRHRLGGFEMHVPALVERREDLGRLLLHFLPRSCWHSEDVLAVSQWAALVEEFALYDWPGNVRELMNFCAQIAAASRSEGSLLVPENIRRALAGDEPGATQAAPLPHRSLHEFDDDEVEQALARARWQISLAARQLQVSRQALYRRIEAIPGLRVAAEIPVREVELVYRECAGELAQAASRLQVSPAGLRRRWRALELVPQD